MEEEPKDQAEETPIPTGEDAPPVEAVEEAEAPAPSDDELADALVEKPKEQKGLKKRFRELTTKITTLEAEKDAAYWKGKAEALELVRRSAPQEEPKKPEAPPPVILPPKPRKEDFKDADGDEDPDAYYEALVDWRADAKFKEREAVAAFEAKQAAERSEADKIKDWFDAAEAKYPDFPTRERMPNLAISPAMADAIMDSDKGHEIAYHLGKNPAEAARIAKLSPVAAIREIGKLEDKLSKLPPKTITNAPPPIKPVEAGAATTVDPSEMDPADFQKHERARCAKEGRLY